MSDGAPPEGVWLYEGGDWTLAADPIPWSAEGGDDVRAKYAEAGYTDAPGPPAEPFLVLGLHSEEARSAAQLTLFVRREPPQCLIDVEGASGVTRTVYAARLPDGLDLMARWAAISQTGALTALMKDLVQPAIDHRGRPTSVEGVLESITRRVARAFP
jgi:hypothetical protein